MQSLGIISVNMWQIIISLANLVIIFAIIKKFLYKPVLKMIEKRQADIDAKIKSADEAKENALRDETYWKEKRSDADIEAENIIKSASDTAKRRSEKIIEEAKDRADGIIREAEVQADLEIKKAEEGIKQEIVEVSHILAEKMISREINLNDHRDIIDSVIEKIGDDNDTDR